MDPVRDRRANYLYFGTPVNGGEDQVGQPQNRRNRASVGALGGSGFKTCPAASWN